MQVQADLAKVGGRSGVMRVPNAWQGLQYFEPGTGSAISLDSLSSAPIKKLNSAQVFLPGVIGVCEHGVQQTSDNGARGHR